MANAGGIGPVADQVATCMDSLQCLSISLSSIFTSMLWKNKLWEPCCKKYAELT